MKGRYKVYKEVSRAMHDIFHEYTDLIEPISLDEAFLDVTNNKPGIPMAVDIAREIKENLPDLQVRMKAERLLGTGFLPCAQQR